MPKRLLLAEDDDVTRKESAEVLSNRGWAVTEAGNGVEALARIKDGNGFDVVVLDIKMPKMSGLQVLEHLEDEGINAPPIIVLSGYLDPPTVEKCRYFGVQHLLKKPYNPAKLHDLAAAILAGSLQPEAPKFDDELLDYTVKRREESLRSALRVSAEADRRFWRAAEPVLVVARRWNSWYPSVFPVIGGAYALVGASTAGDSRTPVAVIDPGFQSMRALMDLGIPWKDFACCLVTHNHPDHLGGIFELMAARHALGEKTKLLCSPASASMLGDCTSYQLEVKELDSGLTDVFPPYQTESGAWSRVRVSGFDTAHEEIGRKNSSKGLRFETEVGPERNLLERSAEVVILGDTEYDLAQHRDDYMNAICRPNVKVAVLHIGSSQLKQGTNKHLYLSGLKDILTSMEHQLRAIAYRGRMLVLVSEWGLEHATRAQIRSICGAPLPGFNDYSPLRETIELHQNGLTKIKLLPADLGLVVGVESGKVYLRNGNAVPPEMVGYELTNEGLKYVQTAAAAGLP